MKTLVLGLVLLAAGTGCLHFQPVGPFANQLGGDKPTTPGDAPVSAAKDVVGPPVLVESPPPAPPAVLVTPGEVTEANHGQAARRLVEEMEADRKAMDQMPRYPEVSYVGRK